MRHVETNALKWISYPSSTSLQNHSLVVVIVVIGVLVEGVNLDMSTFDGPVAMTTKLPMVFVSYVVMIRK